MKSITMKELADLGVLDEVATIFREELAKAVKDIRESPLVAKSRKIVLEVELNPGRGTAVVRCQAKLPAKQTREWTIGADKQGLLFIDDELGK